MHKVWLDSYPPSVQPDIDLTEDSSVPDVLVQASRKYPHRPAFRHLGTTLSYTQVARRVRDFAAWLQHQPGLQKGSRVALMMPNLLQYPIAFFGVLRAGMIVVNVNPLYTARELEHQLRDSGAEAIVILENCAHALQPVVERVPLKYVVTTQIGDLLGFP